MVTGQYMKVPQIKLFAARGMEDLQQQANAFLATLPIAAYRGTQWSCYEGLSALVEYEGPLTAELIGAGLLSRVVLDLELDTLADYDLHTTINPRGGTPRWVCLGGDVYDRKVSDNPAHVAMVDAANLLLYGQPLTVDLQGKATPRSSARKYLSGRLELRSTPAAEQRAAMAAGAPCYGPFSAGQALVWFPEEGADRHHHVTALEDLTATVDPDARLKIAGASVKTARVSNLLTREQWADFAKPWDELTKQT